MDAADVLIKARKILSDPRRWVKETYTKQEEDGTVCYCALGALTAAATDGRHYYPGIFALTDKELQLVREAGAKLVDAADTTHNFFATEKDKFWNVPSFNDDEDTTYEVVMEAFSTAVQQAVTERSTDNNTEAIAA